MKKYSSKRSVQILAHIFQEFGIQDIVVSPGSRNAPIAIHFGELENFNCYSIIDERSAGFVALGMAKYTKKPTLLTCTSGSATANYYPAVTEAFYQNIPLLLLTADRPVGFVDIFDGQTIRQKNIFSQHSYGDFELLEDNQPNADEENYKIIKRAVELCINKQGPVHINIPLEEPLYELVSEVPSLPSVILSEQENSYEISHKLVEQWESSKRIMILVGTREASEELDTELSKLADNHSVVVLCEVNSNLNNDNFFHHIDRYIFGFGEKEYRNFAPDLLITIGQNVVSKKVKQFLREAHPKHHWHIDSYWQPDTYYSLTEKITTTAEKFFRAFLPKISTPESEYYHLWEQLKIEKDEKHQSYIQKIGFSDFNLIRLLSSEIPKNYHIHFSNSSVIRYAQLFDFKGYIVHCNRGTSGIEGSTSTAMGYAVKSENPTLLVTGDISFFYDVNGLWNSYLSSTTRIIVMNNSEGNIFKIIPGPRNANENILNEYIATRHKKTAKYLAEHFGFGYIKADEESDLKQVLTTFFRESDRPKILEVQTSSVDNAQILRDYFKEMS